MTSHEANEIMRLIDKMDTFICDQKNYNERNDDALGRLMHSISSLDRTIAVSSEKQSTSDKNFDRISPKIESLLRENAELRSSIRTLKFLVPLAITILIAVIGWSIVSPKEQQKLYVQERLNENQ